VCPFALAQREQALGCHRPPPHLGGVLEPEPLRPRAHVEAVVEAAAGVAARQPRARADVEANHRLVGGGTAVRHFEQTQRAVGVAALDEHVGQVPERERVAAGHRAGLHRLHAGASVDLGLGQVAAAQVHVRAE
jgi:hypothetical protein